jgi:hypothetical protein
MVGQLFVRDHFGKLAIEQKNESFKESVISGDGHASFRFVERALVGHCVLV